MQVRLCKIWCTAILATIVTSLAAPAPAKADLGRIFGIGDVSITPGSGQATSVDPIHIALGGAAPSSQTPVSWNLSPSGSNELTINLLNPSEIGLTVITPWEFDVHLPALAEGEYDLYVRSIIGSEETRQERGPELLVDDFVVAAALAGDFNGDGAVDGDDYDYWRAQYADGAMSAGDYVRWRNSMGGGLAGGTSAEAALPEPSTLWLVLVASLAAYHRRRR